MPRQKGHPKTGGSKAVEIDVEELQKLAAMGCTQSEIADLFKVEPRTLERKLTDPAIRAEYDHGVAHTKVSIRRQQCRRPLRAILRCSPGSASSTPIDPQRQGLMRTAGAVREAQSRADLSRGIARHRLGPPDAW